MSADELRARIQERLPTNIDSIADIVDDAKATAGNRIKAFNALASRGGLPELKAMVTQQLREPEKLEDMEKVKNELIEEQKSIAIEIESLKAGGVEEARANRDAILPQPNDQEGA